MSDPAAFTRRGISKGLATRHIRNNLVRRPKSKGASEFSGFTLDSEAQFTKEVKSYLVDVSNLSTSTLDAADYGELLLYARDLEGWTARLPGPKIPPQRNGRPVRLPAQREPSAAIEAARKALANVHVDDSPMVPPARKRKGVKVSVAVSVPPVAAVTETVEDAPKRKRSEIPENWTYMAQHANTESARTWWASYCKRWLLGEV